MTFRFAAIILLVVLAVATLAAQDHPPTWVHGSILGDYFYKVKGDQHGLTGQYSKFDHDYQAFDFRRFYLYVDHTFNEDFAGQFLLEGNDGSLDGSNRYDVYVKTAYVEWKNIFPMTNLQFGMVPTPTWLYVTEKIWNYRSIEKTITDFYGLGVATDMGISLRGKFSEDGFLSYHIMVGNGNGTMRESDRYKKFYGSLTLRPGHGITVDAYADHERLSGISTRTTVKGFAAYQDSSFTAGAEVVHQLYQTGYLHNVRPFGWSVFIRGPVSGAKGVSAFIRYDSFHPDLNGNNLYSSFDFFTLGVDYMPAPGVHFMPNLWLHAFDAFGVSLDRPADIVGRVTFYYVYE